MKEKTNQEELVFSENFSEVSSTVLNKYHLKETREGFIKKLKNGEPVFSEIFMDVFMDFFDKAVQPDALPAVLKEKFGLDDATAKNFALDIQQQILPLVKWGIPEEEAPVESKNEPAFKIKPPMGIPPIGSTMNDLPKKADTPQLKTERTPGKASAIKPSRLPPKKIVEKNPPLQQSSKNDTYREPIE